MRAGDSGRHINLLLTRAARSSFRAGPRLPAVCIPIGTVRTARAAVAKVHQVSGLGDPTADGLCKDVLRRIGREGRDRGRGDDPLGADSIRAIVRRRAAAVDGIAGRIGGHSLRVGSARDLAADGASVAELQQAGGWKSPTTPGVYIRREAAARGPVARRRYKVGA